MAHRYGCAGEAIMQGIQAPEFETASAENLDWLELGTLVNAEATSEDPAHPITAALGPASSGGWKALHEGTQTIRLVFNEPQRIKRIRLEFHETEVERTHEFVLRWSPDRGHSYKEIVRQQFNFSPAGATTECEDFNVDLDGVTRLELSIIPNISGLGARATVHRIRIL
jgi:hypothetical protein